MVPEPVLLGSETAKRQNVATAWPIASTLPSCQDTFELYRDHSMHQSHTHPTLPPTTSLSGINNIMATSYPVLVSPEKRSMMDIDINSEMMQSSGRMCGESLKISVSQSAPNSISEFHPRLFRNLLNGSFC
ncbi:hypothetical protein BDEG_25682 [Batrachochytrium dendrobatidis JEL423]|uniref:Uncharacterized protein n=1 Tax=Batrachochytrium dendrobatidis (strain JEL423) TaxID=403673 RepID=A0A177WQM3_BATDL|nr:hypothetical protein BDEG_25682 [Batrachochytrium dendrobatidis JEL423]